MSLRSRPAYLRVLQVVYDLIYAAVLLLCSPVVLFMMLWSRRWRAGFAGRLGACPRREGSRPCLWIHGVSAGEVLAAKALVARLEREMPWIEVVLSTTTMNGHEAAVRTYPGQRIIWFPFDFSFAASRVVDRIRPDAVLLMELELWPNFLLTTTLRGVRVLLANGRISAKSARDYRILQKLIPEPLNRVLHYGVQSEEYAARFRSLGVPDDRITVTGSMKFDAIPESPPDGVREAYAKRLGLGPDAFVLIGGSTHDGEDECVLDAFARISAPRPGARLVLVPRHPERCGSVESLLRSRKFVPTRMSALAAGAAPPSSAADVVVVDTVGELAALYSVADLVFVGGTLTRRGGQNMMEPAGIGKPVVVGRNTWNFRDSMELLRSRGAIVEAADGAAVTRELEALASDPARRAALGAAGRAVCLESRGATERMLRILRERLPGPSAASV